MIKIQQFFLGLIRDTWNTAWRVLKIIIPVSIIVKIFDLMGFITVLGGWLSPVMAFIGLPSSFGLIWATTATANIYSGIYVFLNYSGSGSFTQAQVTVLGTMMLLAHALPIELEVANKIGVKRWFMLSVRIFATFLAGAVLIRILKFGHWLQQTNEAIYPKPPVKSEFIWYEWLFEQLQNYFFILAIVFVILLIMRILEISGLIHYLQKSLAPIIKLLGISVEMIPMTLVGMLLGIVYGGALIIKEKEANHTIHKKEFVFAMILLGLCHAIIEDTLLVMGIGASLWGILLFRTIFALLFTYIFVAISKTVYFKKYLHLITNH